MKDKRSVGYPNGVSRKDKMHVRNMVNHVRDFIESSSRIKAREGIIVSCSAGIDSTCLADILHRVWRISERNTPYIAYVNHGLRPKENNIEISMLKEFSRSRNMNIAILDGKVKKGSGLQNRAREKRYNALTHLCDISGIKHIFVAHNKNDVFEGMMIKLFQGRVDKAYDNGQRVVWGLRPISNTECPEHFNIFRPLLDFTRGDIEKYMKTMNVPWHEDSSNATDDYLRNFIRHNVIPHTFLGNERK